MDEEQPNEVAETLQFQWAVGWPVRALSMCQDNGAETDFGAMQAPGVWNFR